MVALRWQEGAVSHGRRWEKSMMSRGNSIYKGPEAGISMDCFRNREESSVAGGK